jgi:hypothetical protein
MSADRLFLVWSIEHDAWWAPNRIGYTRELHEAGRYPEAEAAEIVTRANIRHFNEAAIPFACISEVPRTASLWQADREALRMIEAAAGEGSRLELLERIGQYYLDGDRANRTPRAYLYIHLGMLIGAWNGPGGSTLTTRPRGIVRPK